MTDKHTLVERIADYAGEDGRIPIPIIDQHKNVVGTAYVSPEDMAHDEAFVDDDGEIWVPPTAWAYFAACRARNEKATRITALEAEKAELVAHLRRMITALTEFGPHCGFWDWRDDASAFLATLAKARQSEGEG